eukprot:SAG31_NODE_3999_length_3677_cov_4.742873_2_plen_94_part_00
MVDIMRREAESEDLKGLVAKLIPEAIGKDIEKACQGIFPLQNVYIRKVKMLKVPKYDSSKLLEMHAGYDLDVGEPVADDEPAEDDTGKEDDEE